MTSKEIAKDKRLKKIYKMSVLDFNRQLECQNYCCAICRRPFPPKRDAEGKQFTPFQDHWHACCPRRLKEFCGKCNRGLLCYLCNKYVVGVLERQKMEVKELLRGALRYFMLWEPELKERGAIAKEKNPVRKAKKRL